MESQPEYRPLSDISDAMAKLQKNLATDQEVIMSDEPNAYFRSMYESLRKIKAELDWQLRLAFEK